MIFANKIELAKRMLQRAFAAGIPARWVAADSFYGRSHQFQKRASRLGWSTWRRAHQALAARYRKASRADKRALSREAALEDRVGPHAMTLLADEGAPLTDKEWETVEPLLPNKPPAGRRYHDHRRVLGRMLWVARTGSSWREMPEEYGQWERAYRRYELWLGQGLWQRILRALGEEALPGPATK